MSRRAQSRALIALGSALLAVAVVGFWRVDQRDQRVLAHGRRYEGTVTRLVPGAGWNPFDGGRIVVAYTVGDQPRQAEVWLDNEVSDYEVGEDVTVVVDGHDVRTTDEQNDPAPLGALLIGTALVGVVAAVWGLLRRRAPRGVTTDGTTTVIPLRTWRVARRRAALELTPLTLDLYLPGFFGARRISTARSNVVAGPSEPEDEPDEDDGLYLKEPPEIARFRTASGLGSSDLALVFRQPVRVPPLRWYLVLGDSDNGLGFGVRRTRSVEGVHLDVALIQVRDVPGVLGLLDEAGVQRVERPFRWLADHRERETDPAAIAEIDRVTAVTDARVVVTGAGLMLGAVVLTVGRFLDDDAWLLGSGLGVMALGWVAGRVAGWRAGRRQASSTGS